MISAIVVEGMERGTLRTGLDTRIVAESLLGMGDMLTLIEKVEAQVDESAARLARYRRKRAGHGADRGHGQHGGEKGRSRDAMPAAFAHGDVAGLSALVASALDLRQPAEVRRLHLLRIVASVIPLSMLAAFIGMNWMGVSSAKRT